MLIAASIVSLSSIVGIMFLFPNCARLNINDSKANNVTVAGQNSPAGTLSCAVAPICPNPPPNCQYVNQVTSSNGCSETCGELQCEGPIQCPMIACAPPDAEFRYIPDSITPENPCPGCGTLICKDDR